MSCAHTSAAEEKEKKRRNTLAKIQRKWLNETSEQNTRARILFSHLARHQKKLANSMLFFLLRQT
jgi:hypothetical protein